MDLKKVCRVCLLPSVSMLSVFSSIRVPSFDYVERKILEILKLFTEISITPNDGLPDNICCDCLQNVLQLYAFKLKLEKSEAILKLYVDKNKVIESDNFQLKTEASLKQLKNNFDEAVNNMIKPPNELKQYTQTDTEYIKTEKIEDYETVNYEQLESTSSSEIFDHDTANQEIVIVQEVKQEPEIDITMDGEDSNESDLDEECSETNLECLICTKTLKNKYNLKAHMITHTEEKLYQCKLCPSKLRSKPILREHIKIHNGEKPFECEVCSKKFQRKSNLTQHMRTHEVFKCEICSKFFTDNFQLNLHMVTHSEEEQFRCEICSNNFRYMESLRAHKRTEHGDKKLECFICSKVFRRQDHLTIHLTVHTGERPFQCEFCPKKKFRTKQGLTEHMNIKHIYRKFKCSKCPILCKSRYLLKRHMMTHTEQRSNIS